MFKCIIEVEIHCLYKYKKGGTNYLHAAEFFKIPVVAQLVNKLPLCVEPES